MQRLHVGREWTVAVWVFSIGLGILLIERSAQPVVRLRSEPPAEFVQVRPEWDAARRAAEEELARVYWQQAVEHLQWRFSAMAPLPEQPPAEFTVAAMGHGRATAEASSASRGRYWRRL